MSTSTTQGSSKNRPFKPKIYQGKRRGQARAFSYYYQDRYQSRYRSNSVDRYGGMPYRGRAQYKQNYRERSQYDQNYRGNFRRGNSRETENNRGQNFRGGYRGSLGNNDLGRDSRASTSRDRIRCFKCREYNHFAKNCPNMTETEKDQTEKMEQMLNLEEDKTALKVLVAYAYGNLI